MMILEILNHDFTVCQIKSINQADFTHDFVFLSKTDDEISLVTPSSCVPPDTIASEPGWKALKISGTLDFGMIGVIAKIAAILAQAAISIFVVSTYNTDYIFIKEKDFDNGVGQLKDNGYIIR